MEFFSSADVSVYIPLQELPHAVKKAQICYVCLRFRFKNAVTYFYLIFVQYQRHYRISGLRIALESIWSEVKKFFNEPRKLKHEKIIRKAKRQWRFLEYKARTRLHTLKNAKSFFILSLRPIEYLRIVLGWHTIINRISALVAT